MRLVNYTPNSLYHKDIVFINDIKLQQHYYERHGYFLSHYKNDKFMSKGHFNYDIRVGKWVYDIYINDNNEYYL